jgi:polysaccharide export outer membrane protein
MSNNNRAWAIALLFISFGIGGVEASAAAAEVPSPGAAPASASEAGTAAGTASIPDSGTPVAPALYRLGPGDEIRVQQPHAEELDGKTERVNDQGFVNLPLVGRLHVGGLTIEETEMLLSKSLSELLVHPQPVVAITEYRSQPVSVLGEVNNSGVIQLQGRKTLIEMLSLAGGLRTDAGMDVQITRRMQYGKLPLPGARVDEAGEYSTAKLNLPALLKGLNPAENITIYPQDIISVPKADQIYVTGDVKRPGGFSLAANGGVSILQAVALAEGFGPQPSPKDARIYRSNGEDKEKTEIPVDLQAIMQGKSKDVALMPKDVVFIPDSATKKAGVKAAQIALAVATGLAWRF